VAERLRLWQDRQRASADVKRIALAHASDLERRIADLQQMQATLRQLASGCHGDDRPECPILDELAARAGAQAPAGPHVT
jgi:hypothetical protein